MAAKNVIDALYLSNIESEIQKALCVGPIWELKERIEKAEKIIVINARNELKDCMAHQIMIFTKNLPEAVQAAFNNFFDQIFEDKKDDE